MRFLNHCVAVAGLMCSLVASAATDRFIGQYWGTGRACYGTLTVTAASVAWLTTFNRCRSPYDILGRSPDRITFRLAATGPQCPFKVLSLTHDTAQGPDNGWDVTGYLSERSYRTDKASNFTRLKAAMSCYLIRDHDFVVPSD